jgi:hypothetical protein
MKHIYSELNNSLQVDNDSQQTIVCKTCYCGCKFVYYYPHCTKQDTKHGGCYESCACQKCKKIEHICETHKQKS